MAGLARSAFMNGNEVSLAVGGGVALGGSAAGARPAAGRAELPRAAGSPDKAETPSDSRLAARAPPVTERDGVRGQKTQTSSPIGMMLFAQIQLIASSLTRTQPWETGTGGT